MLDFMILLYYTWYDYTSTINSHDIIITPAFSFHMSNLSNLSKVASRTASFGYLHSLQNDSNDLKSPTSQCDKDKPQNPLAVTRGALSLENGGPQ